MYGATPFRKLIYWGLFQYSEGNSILKFIYSENSITISAGLAAKIVERFIYEGEE